VEKPTKILEENWKRLRNHAIKFCKVQWKHHSEQEATWEKEEDLRQAYPELFRYSNSSLRDEVLIRGKTVMSQCLGLSKGRFRTYVHSCI
jgi:hypothetical protein